MKSKKTKPAVASTIFLRMVILCAMTASHETARRALVTGAAGAIGKAIAAGLAKQGYQVTAVVRSARQGDSVVQSLPGIATASMTYETCDLSLHTDICELAEKWRGPLHVLVNNAATCPRKRMENNEGIEMQWATNVLGYFRMIQAFEEALTAANDARVVNVASYWAGGLQLNDVEFRTRRYNNDSAYRQSKQADRMLTRAFSEQFADTRVTVNCCHPGDVRSKLSGDLGFGGHETPAQGAATPLYLATSPDVAHQSGQYFAHCSQQPCAFSEQVDAVRQLFNICATYDRA